MKYKISQTGKFKKDLKLVKRRGYDLTLMTSVVNALASGKKLPKQNKDHALKGEYVNCRECHITPDWLLVYEIDKDELILLLTRTGTHGDLFR